MSSQAPTYSVPYMVHSSGKVMRMNSGLYILPPLPNRPIISSSSFIVNPVLQANFKSYRLKNPLWPLSIEAKIQSIRASVVLGSQTPCFRSFFRAYSPMSKLSASWMFRQSQRHSLIVSISAAEIPSQQTLRKSSRLTSPRLRRSKCWNSELTCFFKKTLFQKLATNSLGRISPLFPERLLKQLKVLKMSYLLVILPLRSRTF